MLLTRITPCVLIGIAGAAASAQTIEWATPANGVWNTASNWDPMNVPDTAGEDAVLGHADPYTVGLDLTVGIRNLAILNPSALLSLNASRTLTINGTDLINDGLIEINPQNSASNAVLAFAMPTLLSGVGEIQLRTSSNNSQVVGPGAITNGVDHTIRGVGWIAVPFVNNGEIRADVAVALSGTELDVFGDPKVNNALMSAAAGSSLDITATTIDQTGGGVLMAMDGGGEVRLGTGAAVLGGTIESSGDGVCTTIGSPALDSVTNDARLALNASHTVTVSGSGLVNNGLMQLNNQNSASNAVLHFAESGDLDGSGEIQLRTSSNNSQITTAPAEVIHHHAGHLIRGVGELAAALVNDGEVRADVAVALSGAELDVFGEAKVNNALMSAAAGSRLDITSTTIDQTGGGTLLAMDGGGEVRLGTGAAVLGGTIESSGDGVCTTIGSPALDSVTNDARLALNASHTVTVSGSGLVNNGLMQLNNQNSSSDAVLHFAESGDLDGSGEIQLRASSNNSQITTAPAGVVHHHAGHLIRGVGELTAGLVNDGEVRADVAVALSGTELDVFGDPKVNNALMSAAAGSRLDITSTTIDQTGGGVLMAMDGGGEVRPGSNAVVRGGALESVGDGVVTTMGSPTLEDVTNNASFFLNASHTVTVSGSGLINNGVMTLNIQNSSSDASLRFSASGILGGSGEVQLLRAGNNSNISGEPGVVVTNGPAHTISGLGDVNVDLLNAGLLRPGNSTGVLDLNGALACEPTSVIEAEISGDGTFDSLDVAGGASLGGVLRVLPIDGYAPVFGDAFAVVTAGSVAGEFDAIDAPGLDAPLIWAVQYRAADAVLRVTCEADTNVDGTVNTQDVLAFLNAWTAGEPEGDFNGDGSINTLDVLAFLNAWTTGC